MRLAEQLRRLGQYNKTLVAVSGGVSSLAVGVLGLGDIIPPTLAGYLLAASTTSTAFGVWLVKYSNTIDRLGNWLADRWERK